MIEKYVGAIWRFVGLYNQTWNGRKKNKKKKKNHAYRIRTYDDTQLHATFFRV